MQFMTRAQQERLGELASYEFYSNGLEGWRMEFDEDRLRVHLRYPDEKTFLDYTYERFITQEGGVERWDDQEQKFFPTTIGPRWGWYKTSRDGRPKKYAY